jgi:hypothetical protein
LLNELFRDYLRFNGYGHTLSVFLSESGQPPSPALDRAFLMRELGVSEVKRTEGREEEGDGAEDRREGPCQC